MPLPRWTSPALLVASAALAAVGVVALVLAQQSPPPAQAVLLPATTTAAAPTTTAPTVPQPVDPKPADPPKPPPVPPRAEVPDDTRAEVRKVFAQFEKVVAKGDGSVLDLFDVGELVSAVPAEVVENRHQVRVREKLEPWPEHIPRKLIENRAWGVWQSWDWSRVNVRHVWPTDDPRRVEAVAWHPTRGGGPRAVKWTLRKTDNRWRVVGWEDLRSGATSHDLTAAQADEFVNGHRRRSAVVFLRIDAFYDLLDAKKADTAAGLLSAMQGVRVIPRLRYAVDLAEGWHEAVTREGPASIKCWPKPDRSPEIALEAVRAKPNRAAGHRLDADACLATHQHEKALQACDRYAELAGDDPDVLAVRAAAELALVRPADAAATFGRVLALDPHQPQALVQHRRSLDPDGHRKLAETIAAAPDPPVLFDLLAADAVTAEDVAGVLALAERYHTLRPKEGRGLKWRVWALARQNKPVEASKLLQDSLFPLTAADRREVVRYFVSGMVRNDRAADAYALVPATDADAAFYELGWHFDRARAEDHRNDKGKAAEDGKHLQALIDARQKTHPQDVWVAVFQARLWNAEGYHLRAERLLLSAQKGLPRAGDHDKDWESGYRPMQEELDRTPRVLRDGIGR